MIFFNSDYNTGAHPRIMAALSEKSLEYCDGYFEDAHSRNACSMLRKLCGSDDLYVHLMVGGTITNLICVSAFLRTHEAVISADTGHVNTHETGAIEATGHKIIGVPSPDGKLTAEMVRETVKRHTDEHMVKPRLVYVSQSTEIGTVYMKKDLAELRAVCDEFGLILYLDGARLACGLLASDLKLSDLKDYCDAFYIGGTKNGVMFGEAVVIVNPALREDFRFVIKQKGGMFAKGMLIGMQFEEMFRDNLWFELAENSNRCAQALARGIADKGYGFLVDSPTNQIFPILPNNVIRRLAEKYMFLEWKPMGDMTAIRLVCSWKTSPDDVKEFLADL